MIESHGGPMLWRTVMLIALVAVLTSAAHAGHKVTHYTRETNVPVYVNKIGPFANPSVAYHYNTYPLCKPEKGDVHRQRQGLAAKLDGTQKETSLYAIKYLST